MRKYCTILRKTKNAIESRLFPYWIKCSKYIKSDKLWLRVYYRLGMHEHLYFDNPKNYTQKIQVLKTLNNGPLFTQMVDKYEVRDIVKNKIGEKYLIPLLGVYDRFDDIPFDSLPSKFVLKTTHDSGSVVLCHEKKSFDFNKARTVLEQSLKRNYFYISRETPYKNVKPRIIVEQFMSIPDGEDLPDYKFYCFNGNPEFLAITSGRFDGNTYCDFFDKSLTHLPIRSFFDNNPNGVVFPENIGTMYDIARILSKGFIHVRVDLYNINGNIYFGEYTFHDSGGRRIFEPEKWNGIFGKMISLRNIY